MNQAVAVQLDQEGYRMLLDAKRSSVLAALDEKVTSFSKAERVGDEDLAQHSHEEFISLRLNGLDYQLLKQVDAAIGRLERGEYGVCQRCDEEIAGKRLAAIPWALYCVRCQERIGENRYVDPIEFKIDADDDEA